jgi:hypothetical protein
MNVEIGTKAAQFLFWEHINGIFVAVQIPLYLQLGRHSPPILLQPNGIFVAVQIPSPTFGWTDVLTRAAAEAPCPATVAAALAGAVHAHALLAHATLAPATLAGAGLARAALCLLRACAVRNTDRHVLKGQ